MGDFYVKKQERYNFDLIIWQFCFKAPYDYLVQSCCLWKQITQKFLGELNFEI